MQPLGAPVPGPGRLFAAFLLVALGYGSTVQVSLWLKNPEHQIALFWPAAGVGAVLMIIALRRSVLLGAAVATAIASVNIVLNLHAGSDVPAVAGFALANTAESLIAGIVFVRLRKQRPGAMQAVPCLVLASVMAVAVSTVLALATLLPWVDQAAWRTALNWAVPDLAGLLVVGALVLQPHRPPPRRVWEATAQMLTTCGLSVLVFWVTVGHPLSWLSLPGLLWAAMRLGTTWTALSCTVVALTSSYGTVHGRGPFGPHSHELLDALAGQGFSAFAVLMAMTLAGVVTERERVALGLAMTDPLTGLANRLQLDEVAALALGERRRPGQLTALFYCDLNGFKAVNDTYGHAVGDQVLCAASQRLRQLVRSGDLVARLGGDEFVVLCPDLGSRDAVERVRDRLAGATATVTLADGRAVVVRLSVGHAVTTAPTDLSDLLHQADNAMYLVKRSARHEVPGSL